MPVEDIAADTTLGSGPVQVSCKTGKYLLASLASRYEVRALLCNVVAVIQRKKSALLMAHQSSAMLFKVMNLVLESVSCVYHDIWLNHLRGQ